MESHFDEKPFFSALHFGAYPWQRQQKSFVFFSYFSRKKEAKPIVSVIALII